MSKNDAVNKLGERIEHKLDRIVNLLTILTETVTDHMSEEVYMRSREMNPEIFDPKFYEDE